MKIVDLLKRLFNEETETKDMSGGGYIALHSDEICLDGHWNLEKMQKKLNDILEGAKE